TKDLLFGGDLLQSDSVKVELVPSLRSRLSRAWQNLTSGFELSLSGRAVAFAGLMTVASMALGTFAPVSAEELPTVDSHNYPHYVNEAENVIDGAIAKTEVTPNNHVFRRTAAGGNDGMSGKDGIVGGLRHENTKGGSSNFCSKGPNHGEKSTLPLYKRTMTQLGNAKGYNQCWDQVKDVYTGGGTDSYGPSGYHVNVKHNDFLY
ncbi:hypothetical protein IJT10_04135, partial [bacterium]|nr:hypothetical protein [bacterium]